jgi:hypothetical protein
VSLIQPTPAGLKRCLPAEGLNYFLVLARFVAERGRFAEPVFGLAVTLWAAVRCVAPLTACPE